MWCEAMGKIKAMVIAGSKSDLEKIQPCMDMLESLGIPAELVVASAHRSPKKVVDSVRAAEDAGAEVIIAAAGMNAALPGVVAAHTDLPVIGVPLEGGLPGGLDALFSVVQMPPGIPVAAVAVGAALNAAVLAARILAIKHEEIAGSLRKYRESLAEG